MALVAAGVLVIPTSTAARTEPPMKPTSHPVAQAAYARMSEKQRIGQLFMAGVPSDGPNSAQLATLQEQAIGNVMLDRNSDAGRAAVLQVSESLVVTQTHAGVAPFVSTDQEGGQVQRLTGEGFSRIPTALKQGRIRPSKLRAASTTWGTQLADAGVDMNLAPVADTVPLKHASANKPIGKYHREYGHTPKRVRPHAVAFQRGMQAAGVTTAVKHFPGLGRASGNTDASPHVTDPTTRHDHYLRPFRTAIGAGTQFVMVSSATYPNIDAGHLACFSPTVIRSMLRGDLQFHGAVLSDDFAGAALKRTPLRQRAVKFIAAGGTMLLDTSISELPKLVQAVRAEAAANPDFVQTVNRAVMTDLVTKARAGLITTA